VLGYDVDPGGGRLVVNQEEAQRVRAIYALFEEQRSALATLAEIRLVKRSSLGGSQPSARHSVEVLRNFTL
jgi:hypothetical protein